MHALKDLSFFSKKKKPVPTGDDELWMMPAASESVIYVSIAWFRMRFSQWATELQETGRWRSRKANPGVKIMLYISETLLLNRDK